MDLFTQVDDYCERTDFTFWSEPTNAITNAGFLIAALMALRLYRELHAQTGQKPRWVLVLIIIIGTISVGSFLFHTYATIWAMWADVIPILVFIYLFHTIFLYRAFGWPKWFVALYLAGFYVTSYYINEIFGIRLMNGSGAYLPVIISFVFIATAMAHYRLPGAVRVTAALYVFIISVMFRSIDLTICEQFPLGTHFLWHSLNSVVLYLLLSVLIFHYTHRRPSKPFQRRPESLIKDEN